MISIAIVVIEGLLVVLKPAEKEKLDKLKNLLCSMGRVVIAYSGGVDSSFLLKTAIETLGREKVLPVIAESPSYPETEFVFAKKLARELGANLKTVKTKELSCPDFISNPVNRCYFCKSELFSTLEKIREQYGFNYIIDGSNFDDRADYRPGVKAGEELGVRSPLKEAKLTKAEIRNISKTMGLSTWDKPALACLASRIPYGEDITPEKLERINKAESFIRENGIRHVRVRHHGSTARIEVDEKDIPGLMNADLRKRTVEYFKKLGFKYVTIDIEGYRTGSMNEVLKPEDASHAKNVS